MAANTSASIDLLVTGRTAVDRLIDRVSKLDSIVSRVNQSPLDISRSSASAQIQKLEKSLFGLSLVAKDVNKEIASSGTELQKNFDKLAKAQKGLARLKNPETNLYKKYQKDILDASKAIDQLTEKSEKLAEKQERVAAGSRRVKENLKIAGANQNLVNSLQDLAEQYLKTGDAQRRFTAGGGKGLNVSINNIREQASALSLVSNNVKIASADFNKFSLAVEGANQKLAQAEQQRFRALAFGLSPQAQKQDFGRGTPEANLAGSRKLIASALAMGDTVTRSEAAMDSYLGYLERLRSLVPVISNEYRALEERIASVREDMSGFGLRGQSMKIQPQLGPASRLDDPRTLVKRQNYYDEIDDRLSRIVALEERIDQGFLTQNQKLELRKRLYESFDLLAEKDLRASKRKSIEIDKQRYSLERLNRRAGPPGARSVDFSPLDAPKRLTNILRSGELLQERLVGAETKGLNIGDTLVKLQNALNAAKAQTFEISSKNLDALDEELNAARQLLALEKERAANAQAESKASQQLAKRLGRGQQRDTGTLTSIIGSLSRTDTAAKVFRGGRTGEQALSNIIGAFNASTAPPKASPVTPGPTAPRYTGPDAGREMEIDRYRGIFAGLTNNPRFYNRLLQGLPREAITTTMAGRASDISKAVEDAKRPDRKALESSIRLAYEEAVGNIPSAVTELFDKIGSVFDSIVNRVKGGAGGVGGTGGGGKPPLPPAAGGPEPGDFAGRVDAARGSADKLLGLKDLANLSAASTNQLELLSKALSETRNGLRTTDKGFDELTKTLTRIDDQIARRDTGADFLTRRFGQRRGQAIGEGLIGGAFPLLFGQGLGAAAGGGLGGALGGFAGGTLGFGLSLAGTALGSAFDGVVQAAQDTGNTLRDLVGNFEQIKDSGLLASRGQEKLIANLLEAGNKTAAYAIIQAELNQKLGADGAAKLREAADAGDRMKRAMADLGVQLQLFVAGPLTDFLNRIASAIESRAIENRTQDLLSSLPQEQRGRLQRDLEREARANSPFKGPFAGLFGFDASRAGTQTGGGERSLIPQARLRELIAKYAPFVAAPPQSQSDRSQRAINDAETRQAAAQRELDLFTKTNEGPDILKGFKQQANAIRREQEDIDRQSFELRRDYEKQIEDIRRGVEDKISQLRQENAQKELEILVKQGQIREQQFQNAALALQGALAGDPLAQSLADAVTTYLGAQLSAQNEIEQRRKQFEIEINNQQVELEKYKLDVARTISKLNTDTVEKVAQINLGITRRNEDAALNNFATEKQTAKLKFQLLAAELRVLEAKELNTAAQASVEAQRNPLMAPEYTAQFNAATSNATRFVTAADNIVKNLIPQLEQVAPPQRLNTVTPVTTKGVSFAGVNAQKAIGDRLRSQFQGLSDELTELAASGKLQEFANRISEIASGSFFELSSGLETARKELALLGGDFGPIADGIKASYQDLIRTTAQQGNPFPQEVQDFLLNDVVKAQIAYEKLRPTLQFYADGFQDLRTQTDQARASISELLAPSKNYDRVLQDINKRGGIGINEEYNRSLLQAAKNLDELNARIKVLNGLRDIASGWTDSFIQLNKELLKGGNLLESVQRFAESVADRTLDVVLEFTLRPIQEQLFKNLTSFLGIEAPQDPTLLPIKETAANTKGLLDIAKGQFAGKTGVALPQAVPAAAPANAIVPGPSAAKVGGPLGELLARIRSAEGGYTSASRGFAGDTPGGIPNLVNMTVAQVMSLQKNQGYNALGAYQFIPKTLEGAVSRSGVDLNSKFDERTQDNLALELILGGVKRPALSDYLQGRSNDINAAERDALLEWAGLKSAKGGGMYDGVAGNRGSVTIRDLLPLIRQQLSGGGVTYIPPTSRSGSLTPGSSPNVEPAPSSLGPKSSAMPIGDQFLSQILGSQFEDIAGLQPLPLERMYRQMGRQVQRWTDYVRNESEYWLKKEYGTRKPLIPQKIIDSTIEKVRTITNTIQGFDPLELQFRELENKSRGASGKGRSKQSSISLRTFGDLFSKIERRAVLDADMALTRAGGYLSELGSNADLSDFLPENTKKFLFEGIRQLLLNDSKYGDNRRILENDFKSSFSSFFRDTVRSIDAERGRSTPVRGAAGGRDSLRLPEFKRSPSGGVDYLQRYKELQDLMEPPRIIPGVENQFEGAMLPIGEQFTAMLSGSRFASIASTTGPGMAYPLPNTAPSPAGGVAPVQVVPYQEPTSEVKNLGAASSRAATSLTELEAQASTAADKFQDVGASVGESVTKFQQIVGTGLQAISSVAMGIGGAQMIRKGGTYNTLMGAASIFGSIGSVAGMFGTGGPLPGLLGGGARSFKGVSGIVGADGLGKIGPNFGIKQFAMGGRPEPFMPALIGEEGPELWVPDRPGTIIPNDELYVPGLDDKGGSAPPIGRYSRRAAANPDTSEGSSERSVYSEMYERGPGSTTYVGNYGRSVPYQRSETTREIDRLERVTSSPKELPPIKYETTRVNEYEFVTPEQLEASNARTAKIARNQTIRELADSMKTRKRLGL